MMKKISSGIGAISRLLVCKDTLISAYYSSVQTYFDYCYEVWHLIGNIYYQKLQSLQNRAARIIMGYSKEHGQSSAAMAEAGGKLYRNADYDKKTDSCIKLLLVWLLQCL